MLGANNINLILDALYQAIEGKAPDAPKLHLGAIEIPKSHGDYGAIILGMLFTGSIDGRLTLILDWDTALKMQGTITRETNDVFNEKTQELLDDILIQAKETMAELLGKDTKGLEIVTLPILVDTNVMYTCHNHAVLRLPIQSSWGVIDLYLSLSEESAKKEGTDESGGEATHAA